MSRRRGVRVAISTSAAAAGIVLLALAITRSERPTDGVRPVVWDRTPCAECRMSVSQRNYAAQLHCVDGRVLDFDDPGCVFLYLDANASEIRALYFHHVREERWLRSPQVAFVAAGPSPMGFELGAVDPGTEGTVDLETARERALRRARGGRTSNE